MSDTVYAIASGKGGVGKTTTAINLGAMLADRDYRVVVVDTDLGMANLAGFLDFEIEEPTLHEVLADEADAERAIYGAPGGIDVLPSATDIEAFAKSNPANLRSVVAGLRERYDYVLLDTGAGVSYDTLVPLALADAVLLVATPDVASVRDTAKTGELADRVGTEVTGAVLTQRSSDILNATDVEETLGTDVLGVVPDDDAVPMGVDAGRPLAAFAPNAPAGQAYRELAAVVVGDAEPEPELDEVADEPGDEADAATADAETADAGIADAGPVDAATADGAFDAAESDSLDAPLGEDETATADPPLDESVEESSTASDGPGGESADPLTGSDAAQQARAVIDTEFDSLDDSDDSDGNADDGNADDGNADDGNADDVDAPAADSDSSTPLDAGDGLDSEEPRSVDDLINEHIGADRLAGDHGADDGRDSEGSASADADPLEEDADPLEGDADPLDADDPDIPDIEELDADEFVHRAGNSDDDGFDAEGASAGSEDATADPFAGNEEADFGDDAESDPLADDSSPGDDPLASENPLAGDAPLAGGESPAGEDATVGDADGESETPNVGSVPFERDDPNAGPEGNAESRTDAASDSEDDEPLSDVSEDEEDDDGGSGVFGRIGSLFK